VHVSMCVLAYFLPRYTEIETEKSWFVTRKHMNRISAIKISLKNGEIVKRARLTNYQKLFLNQLDTEEL